VRFLPRPCGHQQQAVLVTNLVRANIQQLRTAEAPVLTDVNNTAALDPAGLSVSKEEPLCCVSQSLTALS
jgi:hypothetical protein